MGARKPCRHAAAGTFKFRSGRGERVFVWRQEPVKSESPGISPAYRIVWWEIAAEGVRRRAFPAVSPPIGIYR